MRKLAEPVWSPSDGLGGPSGEGSAEAAAPEEGTEDSSQPLDGNGFADIAETLNLKADESATDEGASASDEDASTHEVPSDGGKEEQKSAPASEPGEEKKVEEPDLKSTLKELLNEVKGEKAKDEGKKEEPPVLPKYPNVNLPDAMMAALEHEDPNVRRQGLNAMLGAAMSKVYSDVMAEVKSVVDARFTQVPQVVESVAEQKQRLAAMAQEFYGEYPQFNTAKGRQLAAMVGMQVAREDGPNFKGWTPEFRKRLGETLIELTGLQKPPVKDKAPPAKPKFNSGSPASRGDAVPSLSDEIMSTIN